MHPPLVKSTKFEIGELLATDSVSCLAATEKFVIIGTHWGNVFLLDVAGNVIRAFAKFHTATVNHIDIDAQDEWIITCSDDGYVHIYSLFSDDYSVFNYGRPVKKTAIDPERFSKTRQFIVVGSSGRVIMSERNWLGSFISTTLYEPINGNSRTIYHVSLNGALVAWADEQLITIYDMDKRAVLSCIKKSEEETENNRPELFPYGMLWLGKVLLVSFGNTICQVDTSGSGDPACTVHKYDFVLCGICLFEDKVAVLAITETEGVILKFLSQQHFQAIGEPPIGLDIVGSQFLQPNDYRISPVYNITNSFYVVTPKTVLCHMELGKAEQVDWLADSELFEEALKMLSDPQGIDEYNNKEKIEWIRDSALKTLYDKGDFGAISGRIQDILRDSKLLWIKWIQLFKDIGGIHNIVRKIPISEDFLSKEGYTEILECLAETPAILNEMIKEWPAEKYNHERIIQILKTRETIGKDLALDSMSCIYQKTGNAFGVLTTHLKMGRDDVFEIVEKYGFHDLVLSHLELFIEYDKAFVTFHPIHPKQFSPTIKFLLLNENIFPV